MNDKYRMFKNFMYNDLGITKEDIKNWTNEAVKETARNYIENHIEEWDVKNLLRQGREKALNEVAREVFRDFIKEDYVLEMHRKGSEK